MTGKVEHVLRAACFPRLALFAGRRLGRSAIQLYQIPSTRRDLSNYRPSVLRIYPTIGLSGEGVLSQPYSMTPFVKTNMIVTTSITGAMHFIVLYVSLAPRALTRFLHLARLTCPLLLALALSLLAGCLDWAPPERGSDGSVDADTEIDSDLDHEGSDADSDEVIVADADETEHSCSKIGEEIQVTVSDDMGSSQPSLVWTGSGYGLTWDDERDSEDGLREIYFQRISERGELVGSEVRITTNDGDSRHSSLAWADGEHGYGVAWDETGVLLDYETTVFFAYISEEGVVVSPNVRVSDAGGHSFSPFLLWAGNEYGVAWLDQRDSSQEIYFGRISAEGGDLLGLDVRITDDSTTTYETSPSLVWTGSEYGLAWHGERETNMEDLHFMRISQEGIRVRDTVMVSAAASFSSRQPSLVWAESEYGVAWSDDRDGDQEIYYTRISPDGVVQNPVYRITNESGYSGSPSLVWTGYEYGVAWEDERDENGIDMYGTEIYFSRLSDRGIPSNTDIRITESNRPSRRPSLAWTGTEYGVAWEDERDGEAEIYFLRIRCEP